MASDLCKAVRYMQYGFLNPKWKGLAKESLQPFFSAMGCVASIVFSSFGAAYGTAKSSAGVFASGILRPDMAVRNLLPGIFSGILAIYGLVSAVMIANRIDPTLSLYTALTNLGSGLAVGLSSLAAGFTLGIVGDAGTRSVVQQPRMFVSMMLLLIFAEVLGLYGLIVALLIDQRASLGSGLCVPKTA